MKRKLSLAAALLLVCTSAYAQHEHEKKPAAPPMDPAMEAMMKAGMPGEQHKKLGTMAGSWTAKVSMWMGPGTEPMLSDGTSTSQWVLDGRYLEQRFHGSMMGTPFDGLGYTGYDNLKQQYWATWMDSGSTGVFLATGSATDAKTMSFSGTMADPMTGKDTTTETRLLLTDADHHTMEMWGPAPDGKNFKMMEIRYTRKK